MVVVRPLFGYTPALPGRPSWTAVGCPGLGPWRASAQRHLPSLPGLVGPPLRGSALWWLLLPRTGEALVRLHARPAG
ncbi:UNVERIFIED_CONTAM: hypothetical protein K2H54_002239 [Gekko kuhli]